MGTKNKLRGLESEVVRLYQSGLSLESVAKHFGVTLWAVRYHLKKRGVSIRPLSVSIASSWTLDRRQQQRERFDRSKVRNDPGYKLSKRKRVPAILGERNPSWKGGVTPIHRMIRTSPEYKAWRKAVFERDNWTCAFCGARSVKGHKVTIHADHIQPFAEFPDLRFSVSNGRTLCKECHEKTPTYGVNIAVKKLA